APFAGGTPPAPQRPDPSLSLGKITRDWRCLGRKDQTPENGPVDGVHLQHRVKLRKDIGEERAPRHGAPSWPGGVTPCAHLRSLRQLQRLVRRRRDHACPQVRRSAVAANSCFTCSTSARLENASIGTWCATYG